MPRTSANAGQEPHSGQYPSVQLSGSKTPSGDCTHAGTARDESDDRLKRLRVQPISAGDLLETLAVLAERGREESQDIQVCGANRLQRRHLRRAAAVGSARISRFDQRANGEPLDIERGSRKEWNADACLCRLDASAQATTALPTLNVRLAQISSITREPRLPFRLLALETGESGVEADRSLAAELSAWLAGSSGGCSPGMRFGVFQNGSRAFVHFHDLTVDFRRRRPVRPPRRARWPPD